MDNRIPLDNLVSGSAVAEGHKLVFDSVEIISLMIL